MERVIITSVCISAVPALTTDTLFVFIVLAKERKCSDTTYTTCLHLAGKSAEIYLQLCKLTLNRWEADPDPAIHFPTRSQLLVSRAIFRASELWDELRNFSRVKPILPAHPQQQLTCFNLVNSLIRSLLHNTIHVWQWHRKGSAGCRKG